MVLPGENGEGRPLLLLELFGDEADGSWCWAIAEAIAAVYRGLPVEAVIAAKY